MLLQMGFAKNNKKQTKGRFMKINSVLKFTLYKLGKDTLQFLSIDFSFDDYVSAQANVKFVQDEMQEFADLFKRIAIANGLQDTSLDAVVLPHSPIMFLSPKESASMHRMIDLTPIFSYLGGNFDELKANQDFQDFLATKKIYSFDSTAYIQHLKSKR